jgi:transcriptional regulator with XRE-family HTH domain
MDMTEVIRGALRRHLDRTPGLSVNGWAKRAGVSESGLRDFFRGENRSITMERLEKLAKAEGLSIGSLLRPEVPLVGIVGAGAEVNPFNDAPTGGGLEHLEAPPGCPLDAVAVEVQGDSMFPDYWPGDVLFYRRDVPFDRDVCMYQDCVVHVLDGPTLIKRMKPGSAPDRVTLESTNAPPRVDVRVDWAAPVLFHDKTRRRRPG